MYVVQLPAGGSAKLRLGGGSYRVRWFNPRTGGALQTTTVRTVKGPGEAALGAPPAEGDWIVLVTR
jgi:hypothetical protein